MSSKIHILYLITEYSVGGAEKTMVRILSKIDQNKYDITVAALTKGSGRLIPELVKLGIKTETLGAKGKHDFAFTAFRLYKLLKRLNIQVLICSLYHPTIIGRLIGKLAKIPLIINWEVNENLGSMLRVFLNKITLNLSDKIFCDSKQVSDKLFKALHPSSQKVEIVNTGGIDLTRYFNHLNLIRTEISIGSVGRLVEQKGFIYLIEAAKIVLDLKKNVYFYIVGDGQEFHKVEKLINESSLADKIKLLGYHDNIPDLLSEWDIYVQPSLFEGLCLTVVEAIASGLPVVATNVGGIPESVIDGYNGFLVPPKDPKALAEKIITLIDNPDLRVEMGKRSRKIAEEKYSISKMVNNIEELLDLLIKKKISLVWDCSRKLWMNYKSK